MRNSPIQPKRWAHRRAWALALLLAVSCNSPEVRLERLQHHFWEKFAREDFFEIRLKNEVLRLPLPPAPDPSARQKSWAERLEKEANSIESGQLGKESQNRLAQLRAALGDLAAHTGDALFDPSRYVVLAQLKAFSGHPELPLVLEKIPAYYLQVEQRWQTPDVRYVPKAVEASQNTLDLLEGVGGAGGMEAHKWAVRAAIKDFIGLCQSALLR